MHVYKVHNSSSKHQSGHVLLQVYIAPVDKEDLLKQIQALLTEPLGEDFAMVAPALAKACSLPYPAA